MDLETLEREGLSSHQMASSSICMPRLNTIPGFEQFLCACQKLTKAIEEATEILDRRAGRVPKTSHDPVDFLDPSTYPSSSESDDDAFHLDAKRDLRPPPLDRQTAKLLSARQAMDYLLAVAHGCIPDTVQVRLFRLPRTSVRLV
jgi:hypothetical protein